MRATAPIDGDLASTWAGRASELAFDDWAGLAAWLDGDPGRNAAFERAMAAIARFDAAVADSMGAGTLEEPPATPRPVARARYGIRLRPGIVIAAAAGVGVLATALAVSHRPTDVAQSQVVAAADARARSVRLADGTRVDLACGAAIRVYGSRRRADLLRGRAVFTVRHDDAAPFRVSVGGRDVVDVGTIFEVERARGGTTVSVAEGRVIVDPRHDALTLDAGYQAEMADRGPMLRRRILPDSVGQWRRDRLTFAGARLERVTADLSAALGMPVAIDPSIADRRFTGTLVPSALRARPQDLGALLDVRVIREEAGWRLRAE
ncbi:FecR domain-containing protein [Sphingomonas sp. A2-49]|uniref:FecR family protein n=1 Tax=Sphingomonas sp. A2-49 TaxID=1391375 RepID=UPI0021D3DE0E|nr:FecR domain-containing protein [Sphingomonas sp. A2-49]MCU6453893.1 FecR domain-containing protein [Sphingomonas sp. A2-49]